MAEINLNDVRPEVAAFAVAMEERLRANEGGWKRCPIGQLADYLTREVAELERETLVVCKCCGAPNRDWKSPPLPDRVRSEAADVANFAMMIADVCGALRAPPAPSPEQSAREQGEQKEERKA